MSDAPNSPGAAATVERPNIFCAPTRARRPQDDAALSAGEISASGTEPHGGSPRSWVALRRATRALERGRRGLLAAGAVVALGAAIVLGVSLLRSDADRSRPVMSTPNAQQTQSLAVEPRTATARAGRRR